MIETDMELLKQKVERLEDLVHSLEKGVQSLLIELRGKK